MISEPKIYFHVELSIITYDLYLPLISFNILEKNFNCFWNFYEKIILLWRYGHCTG